MTAVLIVLVPAPVVAAPGDGAAPGESPASGGRLAPVMLVLDASGSMRETLPSGATRMSAAKTAVKTLLAAAPADARLGLAVYGTGTGNTAAEKERGCRDVRVIPGDRAALATAVDGVQPRGYTPIGHALTTAAGQLPETGPRSIVLVSDGIDTCTPADPCELARGLRGVRIHAIGFAVDATARGQLTCLTAATYVDAVDAASLTGALTRVTRQALRAYDAAGAPVAGTTTPPGAPRLRPGAYLDRIGPDEDRFYSVDVPPGWTLYATASAVLATGGDYLVHVGRYDPAGKRDCPGRATGIKTEGPVGTAALRWTSPQSGTDTCARPGEQLVRVTLDAVLPGDPASELELLVGLEPPADGGPGTAGPVRFAAPTAPPAAVVGGGSFGTATTLDGTGAYTDTVVPGEMVFYRVHLDWGRGFAYRLRVPGSATGGSVFVKTAWYDPARDEVDAESAPYGGKDLTIGPLAGPPVRHGNRNLPNGAASVAGWYYVSVYADAPVTSTPLPVTLELAVTGGTAPAPYADDPFGSGTVTAPAPEERSRVAAAALLAAAALALIVIVALLAWRARVARLRASGRTTR